MTEVTATAGALAFFLEQPEGPMKHFLRTPNPTVRLCIRSQTELKK